MYSLFYSFNNVSKSPFLCTTNHRGMCLGIFNYRSHSVSLTKSWKADAGPSSVLLFAKLAKGVEFNRCLVNVFVAKSKNE